MPKSFYIATFGCRTNQADSAAIREDFVNRDFRETGVSSDADVIVVNSCTVTHRSDQQVRQLVRRLRRENPKADLLVTGCYAQRDPWSLARIRGVDSVVGNTHKQELVQIASARSSERVRRDGEGPASGVRASIYREDFSGERSMPLSSGLQPGGRTRPFVKIQDGCDAKCSYCIIPSVRGPSRSVPPEQILWQIRELTGRGYKEVVLTGIHMGTYGLQFRPRYPLYRLLEDILSIRELRRLRISSLEPMELSRRVVELAAGSAGRIAPHFHICLQSGSDRILKRMFRSYTTSRFARIVQEIRRLMPDAGIGTDVIVGFPGETDEDHGRTREFVKEMPFTYLHVFPYSDRSGTRASGMGEKVDPETISRRSEELRRLSSFKNQIFRERFLGRKLRVVSLDQGKNGERRALSGNYLTVQLDSSVPGNQILDVEIFAMRSNRLLGRPIV